MKKNTVQWDKIRIIRVSIYLVSAQNMPSTVHETKKCRKFCYDLQKSNTSNPIMGLTRTREENKCVIF